MKWYRVVSLCVAFFSMALTAATAASPTPSIDAMIGKGSVIVADQNNHLLFTQHSRHPKTPASIIKLLTGLIALKTWGENYHFKTDFYLDTGQWLIVKGYGDPFLLSEQIFSIAYRLSQVSLPKLQGIKLDSSYFEQDLKIDGIGQSDNPFDATLGAIAANFNTVFAQKSQKEGAIKSAEIQTPLTPIAIRLAQSLLPGSQSRVNLGDDPKLAAYYFAELLAAFLRQQGIQIGSAIEITQVSDQAKLIYQHKNQYKLQEIVQAMLKYSNNFIANQLFIKLGAERYGAPGNIDKAVQAFTTYAQDHLSWQQFTLMDGAGISRNNKVNAEQIAGLLSKFRPYRRLLPQTQSGVFAKTGTLTGVQTYAGYIQQSEQQVWHFVIMFNRQLAHNYRNIVLNKLIVHLRSKQ